MRDAAYSSATSAVEVFYKQAKPKNSLYCQYLGYVVEITRSLG